MNKYKVEFMRVQKYIFDVLAKDEQTARELAEVKFGEAEKVGVLHYHEEGDEECGVSYVYDVTDTDDPFDPQ